MEDKMRKCTNCGAEFERNFCPACGTEAAHRKNARHAAKNATKATSSAPIADIALKAKATPK